jgi:hypothetical protein
MSDSIAASQEEPLRLKNLFLPSLCSLPGHDGIHNGRITAPNTVRR